MFGARRRRSTAGRKELVKLKIEISIGNDACSTPEQVAEVLATTIQVLGIHTTFESLMRYGYERRIRDINGNTVGKYWIDDLED